MTLKELTKINIERSNRWHPGGLNDWSILEWAAAMAGEAGEACNAAKKVKRLEDGIQSINEGERHFINLQTAKEEVGKEVADTILYALLLAARAGCDIEESIETVFNKKSIEYGFPERIEA